MCSVENSTRASGSRRFNHIELMSNSVVPCDLFSSDMFRRVEPPWCVSGGCALVLDGSHRAQLKLRIEPLTQLKLRGRGGGELRACKCKCGQFLTLLWKESFLEWFTSPEPTRDVVREGSMRFDVLEPP